MPKRMTEDELLAQLENAHVFYSTMARRYEDIAYSIDVQIRQKLRSLRADQEADLVTPVIRKKEAKISLPISTDTPPSTPKKEGIPEAEQGKLSLTQVSNGETSVFLKRHRRFFGLDEE